METAAFDMTGRTVLVTGASRGIGRSIARELGGAGARVGVHCRSRIEDARAVVGEIEAARSARHEPGGAAFRADLTRPAEARRLVEECRRALGPIDTLVLSAGIWNDMPIDAVDERTLDEMIDLNLKSLFHVTGAVVPDMKEKRFGRIVTISSTASLLGEPGHAHYAASKGAMDAFVRSLAVELGPSGITVNSAAPGWTLTEMTKEDLTPEFESALIAQIPTRRIAAPEDVAHVVRFLVSREARHVNGVTIPVEGGYRIRR